MPKLTAAFRKRLPITFGFEQRVYGRTSFEFVVQTKHEFVAGQFIIGEASYQCFAVEAFTMDDQNLVDTTCGSVLARTFGADMKYVSGAHVGARNPIRLVVFNHSGDWSLFQGSLSGYYYVPAPEGSPADEPET
jgi:hypothetical protein